MTTSNVAPDNIENKIKAVIRCEEWAYLVVESELGDNEVVSEDRHNGARWNLVIQPRVCATWGKSLNF
jgi:hypothetical protein